MNCQERVMFITMNLLLLSCTISRYVRLAECHHTPEISTLVNYLRCEEHDEKNITTLTCRQEYYIQRPRSLTFFSLTTTPVSCLRSLAGCRLKQGGFRRICTATLRCICLSQRWKQLYLKFIRHSNPSNQDPDRVANLQISYICG